MPPKGKGSSKLAGPEKAAKRLIKIRPRSTEEVRYRLRGRGFDEKGIEVAIKRLTGAGLLDDEAFAAWWVNQRTQFRPSGAFRIKKELQEKRVARTIIEHAVEKSGILDAELTLADEALAKKKDYYRRFDFNTRRRRISGFLARRGFSSKTISIIIKKLSAD